jgi:hypothetical protein
MTSQTSQSYRSDLYCRKPYIKLTNYHERRHVAPEDIPSQSLGQEIRTLIIGGHMDNLNSVRGDHIADPVELDVDVLGALVVDMVHRELPS